MSAVRDRPAGDTVWSSFLPTRLLTVPDAAWNATGLGRPQRLRGVVLFADVSGFTAMSEAATRAGPAATERLSDIVNRVFGPIVDLIHAHGGDVAAFLGDAVLAVFPAEDEEGRGAACAALACAAAVQTSVRAHRRWRTAAGSHELRLSIGVGAGTVTGTVVGDPRVRLVHVLDGPALRRCARAEELAGRDGVVAARTVLRMAAESAPPVLEPLAGGFARIEPAPVASHAGHAAAARVLGREIAEPFLPPGVGDRVRAGREALSGEHRCVTTVFCALPSSGDGRTITGRRLQAIIVAALTTIADFDGWLLQVDRLEGGGRLKVLFGAPVAHDDDERRAVACAVQLGRLPELAGAGIAVNTGILFCGLIGSDVRRDYTVFGDAVNVTARLAGAARPGSILVGEATRRRAGREWRWLALGAVSLRGRAETVAVFEPGTRVAGPAAVPAASGAMIGRARELTAACVLLDDAVRGAGRVLAITGEPGIGKTRFVTELAALAAERGVETIRGAGQPYGPTTSYAAWRSPAATLLGWNGRGAPSGLTAALDALAPGWGDRAPLLRPVLGVEIAETDVTASLAPHTRTSALHELVSACLRARASRGALLVVLEDWHWMDAASRTLLEHLAGGIGDCAVLLAVTSRAVEQGLPSGSRLHLETLPEAPVARVAREAHARGTGNAAPPPGLVEAVVRRAGGNPLYAEELVALLCTRPPDRRGLAAGRDELPDGVRAVITARIDALEDRDRATLAAASVIGPRFRGDWLAGAEPALGGPVEVRGSLRRLRRLELVLVDRSAATPVHVFRHALTRDVAYETLAVARRAVLHERIAGFVERTEDVGRPEVLERLAYHYGASADRAKQRVYFRLAGDAAKRTYATGPAEEYYRRLLPLLPRAERPAIRLELADVLQLTGAWPAARRLASQALRDADGLRDARLRARAKATLGGLAAFTEDYPAAASRLEDALADFTRCGDRTEAARVLERLAHTYFQQGDDARAVARAERHRVLARELGDRAGESVATGTLGLVLWHRGALEPARSRLEEALRLARAAGHRPNVVHVLNDLAGLLWELDRVEDAIVRLREAHTLAGVLGYRRFAGVIVGNAAQLYATRGDHAQALQCAGEALRTAMALNDVIEILHVATVIAGVRRRQGWPAEADALAVLAAAAAGASDSRRYLCDALLEQARCRAALGRTTDARAAAAAAHATATAIGQASAVRHAAALLAVLDGGGTPCDDERGGGAPLPRLYAGEDPEPVAAQHLVAQARSALRRLARPQPRPSSTSDDVDVRDSRT